MKNPIVKEVVVPQNSPRWLNRRSIAGLLLLSFIAIIPFAMKLAERTSYHPYHPGWNPYVLQVWPDHVELQELNTDDGVIRRPDNAPYTFLIPRDREKLVREQLKQMPPAPCSGVWDLDVIQRTEKIEEIELDCVYAKISGLRYQATSDTVHAVNSRFVGAGEGFVFLFFQMTIWGGIWLLIFASYWIHRQIRKYRHV
jgi:hypothetical protein